MCVASVVRADATPGSSDLGAEIAALKARIAQLEGEQGQTWLNERRAEEVKTLVKEVLADADTRASLLAEGATAGHDGGHFWIGSADGSFLLRVSGLIQVRHTWNQRDGDDEGTDAEFDQSEAGFTVPRAKVQFDGHISSPKITYALRLAVDKDTNDVWADRIVVGYQLSDNLWLSAGEDKAPFLREELTAPEHQLAVDRSVVNEIFTAGRVQGAWVNWNAHDMVRVAVAITDGINSGERKTEDDESKDFYADDTDFSITSRVDIRLAGNWEQAEDFTAWSGEPMAVFVGGAVHYQVRETGDSLAGTALSAHQTDALLWTVDGSLEVSGLNVYAAVVGSDLDRESDAGGDDNEPWGAVVQAGYQIIPDKLELFGRWEYIDLDSDDADIEDEINILTFGANWYLNRHQSKVTVDIVYALDSLEGLSDFDSSLSNLGLLTDLDDEEDQLALRTQFTLTY
jgi:hypothetical protein